MRYGSIAAFLAGLEGVALLRACAGDSEDYDRAYVEARLAELRTIVDLDLGGAEFGSATTLDGYRSWSQTYDTEDNPLLPAEQPTVHRMLGALPAGDAIDLACGTGRHTVFLAERGHRVIGVDQSPEMVQRAEAKVPAGRFLLADITAVPLPTASADLVVCSLALTHLPGLDEPVQEMARLLRPGGHAVLSDIHVLSLYLGGVAKAPYPGPDGEMLLMPASRYFASDYIAAFRNAGFDILECEEPRWGPVSGEGGPFARFCPEAAAAAYRDTPAAIVWHVQKPD